MVRIIKNFTLSVLLSHFITGSVFAQLGSNAPLPPPSGLIGNIGGVGGTQDINNLQDFTNGQFPDINRSSPGIALYSRRVEQSTSSIRSKLPQRVMRYICQILLYQLEQKLC